MPDKRSQSQPKRDIAIGVLVSTKDGKGQLIGYSFRKNTNGGPGTKQYIVELNDGRVRHYSKSDVVE